MSTKKGKVEESEDILQAVIIAEPFHKLFEPLLTDSPQCLMPLANRPLLSYTLEWLKFSDVKEVFIYTSSYVKEIESFLNAERWTSADSSVYSGLINIKLIVNVDCWTLGGAMRDLDEQGILRQNFLLLRADCISNADLRPIVNWHKKRCQEDKNTIMTLVYKQINPAHTTRTVDETQVVAIEEDTDRLVFHANMSQKNYIDINLQVLQGSCCISLRYDLIDVGIMVCSPSVPLLFSENFDYSNIDDFLRGTLQFDLTSHTIYVETALLDKFFAGSVRNFHTYNQINQSILNRCLYPIVPETPHSPFYRHFRYNIYKCDDFNLERGVILEECLILGSNCSVGTTCVLSHVSIGKNCSIGSDCIIKKCIIHDGVVLEKGCRLENCVLGNDVKLHCNVFVGARSVLGPGVEIPAHTRIPPESRITAFSKKNKSPGRSSTNLEADKAFAYDSCDDEENDDDEDKNHNNVSVKGIKRMISNWGIYEDEIEFDDAINFDSSSDDDDFGDVFEDDAMVDIVQNETAKNTKFNNEILDLLSCVEEKFNVENVIVDINSRRHAYSITSNNVIAGIVSAILLISQNKTSLEEEETSSLLLNAVKESFKLFKPLLDNYIRSVSSELAAIRGLVSHVSMHETNFLPIIGRIFHFLYDSDILSEDSLLEWSEEEIYEDENNPGFLKRLQDKLIKFMDWLQQDSESD